jgi:hypothetical protein
MKDNHPQIAQLTENIETVEQWSAGPQWKEHAAWLDRAVAWDIVAAVAMTWAAREVEDEPRVDGLLRSGLAEISAGPGDHVVALVKGWRRTLGEGRCQVTAASGDDQRWLRERLALPPPRGAGIEARHALAGFAKRAAGTSDVVCVSCGGAARLVVGTLDGRLVPILRS